MDSIPIPAVMVRMWNVAHRSLCLSTCSQAGHAICREGLEPSEAELGWWEQVTGASALMSVLASGSSLSVLPPGLLPCEAY